MFPQIRSFFNSLFSKPAPERTGIIPMIDPGVFSASDSAAMKVSAVFSAVKLISEGIARLPLEAQRRNLSRGGCYVPDVDSPIFRVLRLRPNADMTAFELWRAAVQCMLLYGNAYLLPTRNALGDVVGLTLLSPGTVFYDVPTREYRVTDHINNIFRRYPQDAVIRLRNVGLDGGHTGRSTITMCAQSLGIMRLADNNCATTLTTGGRMPGFLSSEGRGFGSASMAQLDEVSASVERDIAAGKTVVPIPGEMKYQPFTLTPADAKVLESKQVTLCDIARFFRVHPDLLYAGTNNTYKAAEVPNVMFLTQTLEPLLVQIEQELAVKLLPANMLGKKRLRFDRDALYSTDLLTEGAYNEKLLQTGLQTVNELRAKKGLPPVDGGDVPLVSANLRGLREVIAEVEPNKNNNNDTKEGSTLDQ